MKVLWVCNIKPSGIGIAHEKIDFGGWMIGMYKGLKECSNISIDFVYPNRASSLYKKYEVDDYCCYELPAESDLCIKDQIFRAGILRLLSGKDYDCVHIWGTEYPHSLATIDAACELGIINRVIIWVQGLCSICAKHYIAGLPHDVYARKSLRDILRHDGILDQKRKFEIRGRYEVQAVKKNINFCCRTEWDSSIIKYLNPNANIYFCNETMRPQFYLAEWSSTERQANRLFVSQGTYPIKGLHNLLEAMVFLKETQGIQVNLYIGGTDITASDTVLQRLKLTSYAKYLRSYIKANSMEDRVHFLGPLSQEEMIRQYKLASIFILCSEIENSPNSLGEAMLIGTPSIAADVGGVRDMLKHGVQGLIYPAKESYRLAIYIKELLDDIERCESISKHARVKARTTHNVERNAQQLVNIYRRIGSCQHR